MQFSLLLPTVSPCSITWELFPKCKASLSFCCLNPSQASWPRQENSLPMEPFSYFQSYLLSPPFPQIQPSRSFPLGCPTSPLSAEQTPTFPLVPSLKPPPLGCLPWFLPVTALFLFLLYPCDPLCTHLCLDLSAGLSSPPEHELFQSRHWAPLLSVPCCQARSLASAMYPTWGSYKSVERNGNEPRLWGQSRAMLLTVTLHLHSSISLPIKRG